MYRWLRLTISLGADKNMHFNFVGIFRTIGAIMIIFGTIMLVPALVSVYYSEPDTMKSWLPE